MRDIYCSCIYISMWIRNQRLNKHTYFKLITITVSTLAVTFNSFYPFNLSMVISNVTFCTHWFFSGRLFRFIDRDLGIFILMGSDNAAMFSLVSNNCVVFNGYFFQRFIMDFVNNVFWFWRKVLPGPSQLIIGQCICFIKPLPNSIMLLYKQI